LGYGRTRPARIGSAQLGSWERPAVVILVGVLVSKRQDDEVKRWPVRWAQWGEGGEGVEGGVERKQWFEHGGGHGY
jgi:hypothetical protein